MSLGARATKGGARVSKEGGKTHTQDKGKGPDKPQAKEKVKPQATTEQLRMAHMIDRKNDDASDVRRMVQELMEMTCRTEEEVCSALHDTDNDMQAACNLLLEDTARIQGEWQTREKKKKKPAVAVGNGEVEPPPRDPRSRSGPRPRRGEGEGAGRGRGSARGRGGRMGRAGRGGRRGPPPRLPWQVDAENNGGNIGDTFPQAEDWDNEEWSGSLTDTKVFTPSAAVAPCVDEVSNSVEDWDTPVETNNGHTEPHIPTYTYHNATRAPSTPSTPQQTSLPRASPSAAPANPEPPLDAYHSPPQHQLNPMGMSGTLSAAQSQYLSQLTQQSQRLDNSVYTSNYGVYGTTDMTRKPQRARVPPPSKFVAEPLVSPVKLVPPPTPSRNIGIPVSAVEMPGGAEPGIAFLDVQFGALEPGALRDTPPPKQQVTSQPEPPPAAPVHEPAPTESANNSYSNTSSMLSESLSVPEPTPNSQPQPVVEPTVTNSTTSLEKQLTSSMKQLSVSAASPPAPAHHNYASRPKATVGQPPAPQQSQPQNVYAPAHHPTVGQPPAPQQSQPQNVYAPAHHPVSHHPPAAVYGANVYAPQVNSTNGASLTGQPAMTAAGYPSSVTLSQYQPMINSYQQQQTSSSAGVYGGAALYTHAPYTYQQHTKLPAKDAQYDSSVASSNSLTNTSTTQTSTAKVTTTTASSAGSVAAYAVQASPAALYGQQATTSYAYDEQCLRPTLPHHISGYYEVGYGVSGAREGTFGLGAGERFGRADAASPQQVPAALPPGYAYFYQPPPTTYQYGVYPYGGGSNVGGVGGVGGVGSVSGAGKVSTYTQQQPPYEPDSYKAAGPYNASASKSAAGGAAAADLTSAAMYAKAHQALNKVNSYEKATFHSGTPPPFGAASHHLYIPGPPHHHHHPLQQHHQMDVRVNSSQNRRESATGGAGGAAGGGRGAGKPSASKPYSQSYWPPN